MYGGCGLAYSRQFNEQPKTRNLFSTRRKEDYAHEIVRKSYDPAVLFAGLTYLYGLRVNPSDPRWSLAKHNYGFQVGYTYAVNDNLALSTAFLGTHRNTRSPDGIAIPPAREYYALQLGTTWLLARNLFVEPSVAMRVGGDTPGLTVSLNFSHSLLGRRKP